ncbi:general substrate transporter, partial [Mycena floridula]
EILATLHFEKCQGAEASWKDLFRRYTRRLSIAVTAQMFSQLNGISAILHFLPETLERAGFSIERSLLYSAACVFLLCAGTIPTILYVDRFGRKLFLLVGSIGLALSLTLIGGLYLYMVSFAHSDGTMHRQSPHYILAGHALYLFVFGAT